MSQHDLVVVIYVMLAAMVIIAACFILVVFIGVGTSKNLSKHKQDCKNEFADIRLRSETITSLMKKQNANTSELSGLVKELNNNLKS